MRGEAVDTTRLWTEVSDVSDVSDVLRNEQKGGSPCWETALLPTDKAAFYRVTGKSPAAPKYTLVKSLTAHRPAEFRKIPVSSTESPL